MVQNRIKELRARLGISGRQLLEKLPENERMSPSTISYIERGVVLPTKESLEALCKLFDVEPADIYAVQDIDLASVRSAAPKAIPIDDDKPVEQNEIVIQPAKKPNIPESGSKMEQVRVWFPAAEKAALFRAIYGLGYHSVAEWLREKYRDTLREYIALRLKDEATLHEAVPPTTENQKVTG